MMLHMAKYKTYMKQFKDSVFIGAAMNALIDQYSTLHPMLLVPKVGKTDIRTLSEVRLLPVHFWH